MATRRATCLVAILLVVSLVFIDEIKGEAVAGISKGTAELGRKAGSVAPRSTCKEHRLYSWKGPCVEVACMASCVLTLQQGGHCGDGNFFYRYCLCFVCD
ncbi:hypothetical protein BS78_06G064600 [Paspalum vaginatum]|nr:hypothetical protein BS78_06G064600 [Paspalum vaginatum]